jgi:biopolymer transport protein ExbD
VIAALLLGLAAVGPAAPDDAAGHQTVTLSWDAETKACHARVGGIEIGDPTTDEGEAALTATLSDKQRAVQLQGLNGVPYACVDMVLSTLRKSGHAIKVGFISEPAGR